jgi:hypothetical protein
MHTALMRGRILFDRINFDHIGVLWSYAIMRDRRFDPVLTAIQDHNGGVHAIIEQSVAIREGSPNYANAWEFIKLLLDESTQYGRIGSNEGWAFRGFVVNNAALERQITEVLQEDTSLNTGEGTVDVKAMSMDEKQVLIDLINSISSVSLNNFVIGNFYSESMEPFFTGRQSHDNAMDELRRRLRIYISE